MIQMFHVLGMLELWLKPLVGKPPALLYSLTAQTTVRKMATAPEETARRWKRRLRSICLIAASRAQSSPCVAGLPAQRT